MRSPGPDRRHTELRYGQARSHVIAKELVVGQPVESLGGQGHVQARAAPGSRSKANCSRVR